MVRKKTKEVLIRYRFVVAVVGCLLGLSLIGRADVITTRHNLSISGPGTIKATTEQEVCIFCHIPHNSNPSGSLWSRNLPGNNYEPYSSSTAVALPGQPTGSSILCLSCHDGTIALGDVLNRTSPIDFLGGVTTFPSGPGLLGTDLSDDHPISFPYTAALANSRGELVQPSELTGPVKLDSTGQMQCTACHDPHDDRYGKFLTLPVIGGELCITCHLKNFWEQSAHHLSLASWNGVLPDPWPNTEWTNVSDNACLNCHLSHNAGEGERLLQNINEEDNCLACHNGNVANKNVSRSINKLSRHPVHDTSGVHDPTEQGIIESRHVECEDCHNPHAVSSSGGLLPGSLNGVRGISIDGLEIDPVTYEYEICFRCHGDSLNKPPARTPRQHVQTNVRLEFQNGNPSYHPVAATGVNPDVPSLRPPYTVNSIIKCTDCHADNSSSTDSTTPLGSHGSDFSPILKLRYEVTDNISESSAVYALCYSCHDRNSILGDDSFREHRKHIDGERTPCNVCHDPHGVSSIQGTTINNSNLINFDTAVVFPSSNGLLRWESRGRFAGACYLTCHGQNHNPETY